MKKIAREYFMQRRGNCAQAVAAAWSEKTPGAAGREAELAGCGHGQAPDGACGALYASCHLAGGELAESIKSRFMQQSGGHAACREIRAARSLRCIECVELAATLLEEHLNSQNQEHTS